MLVMYNLVGGAHSTLLLPLFVSRQHRLHRYRYYFHHIVARWWDMICIHTHTAAFGQWHDPNHLAQQYIRCMQRQNIQYVLSSTTTTPKPKMNNEKKMRTRKMCARFNHFVVFYISLRTHRVRKFKMITQRTLLMIVCECVCVGFRHWHFCQLDFSMYAQTFCLLTTAAITTKKYVWFRGEQSSKNRKLTHVCWTKKKYFSVVRLMENVCFGFHGWNVFVCNTTVCFQMNKKSTHTRCTNVKFIIFFSISCLFLYFTYFRYFYFMLWHLSTVLILYSIDKATIFDKFIQRQIVIDIYATSLPKMFFINSWMELLEFQWKKTRHILTTIKHRILNGVEFLHWNYFSMLV